MICIDPEIIAKLSSKGVLAYLAVSVAGTATVSTAVLASIVKAQTAVILEGLKELAAEAPQLVTQNKKERTWSCHGSGSSGGGPVQVLESSTRYADFVDDLKKYWDHVSMGLPFPFAGPDGIAVRSFLSSHQNWTREMWRDALRQRATSVKTYGNGSRTEGFVTWVRRLGDYAGGPLNQFNKPVEGMGNAGKVIATEHSNKQAIAAYLSGQA